MDTLKAEFGGILTERILEAEALDFLWDARVAERYLGQQIGWIWTMKVRPRSSHGSQI